MTCLGCGRTLKSEKSIQIGYGPVCYRKMFLGKRRLPWMEIGEITLWQMIKIIRYQVSIAYLII